MTLPEKPSDFLRSLAQNDYMIDNHYLPSGHTLHQIADHIDHLENTIEKLKSRLPD